MKFLTTKGSKIINIGVSAAYLVQISITLTIYSYFYCNIAISLQIFNGPFIFSDNGYLKKSLAKSNFKIDL